MTDIDWDKYIEGSKLRFEEYFGYHPDDHWVVVAEHPAFHVVERQEFFTPLITQELVVPEDSDS